MHRGFGLKLPSACTGHAFSFGFDFEEDVTDDSRVLDEEQVEGAHHILC